MKTLPAILVCISALASFTAGADPRTPSQAPITEGRLSLRDLDLSTPAGVAAAEKRLAAMALRLCGRFSDKRRIDDHENAQDCYRETMARSVNHLNALLRSRTPDSPALAQN